MAEKGGKGFSTPRAKTASKSTSKKQGSLKGKDVSASKKTTHVVLESLDSDSEGFVEENGQSSPKVNEKTPSEIKSGRKKVTSKGPKSGDKTSSNTSMKKGDWGKGGKGLNSGKGGGKSSLPQATPVQFPIKEVELKLEIEFPKNARLLMDCEAATVLQGIQDHLTVLSDDPTIKTPESFNKALQYANDNSPYTDAPFVRQTLETLKGCGVTDGELCMIGNISPETLDEVYALIPTLKVDRWKNEGPIREALASLVKFRASI